jgi:threonine dehydrogenase-like Zn-dependent dehydrogenase
MAMRALRVVPGQPNSAALEAVDEPPESDGAVLVETTAVGICGTDVEIVAGEYGWSPPGRTSLILGHEAAGRVTAAPPESGFSAGDLVVPIVRRPDPVPCRFCAVGEWDMCVNGRYTERGIKERDGYASDRFRIEPEYLVPVPSHLDGLAVLVEPASVVAKAWDHIERIGERSRAWSPSTVLVTGAGPIGLLAALLARQRGAEVHVFDRVADGPKPQLVADLGATYHNGDLSALHEAPDIIIECTGAAAVLADVIKRTAAGGIVCLAGVSAGGNQSRVDLGEVNRRMVLDNDVIFGSVNANRRHYAAAVSALANADAAWLARLITRRVPIDRWRDAFTRQPDDVKTVLEFQAGHV